MEKLKVNEVVLVEGKYDKIKLDSLLDATIVTTDGFGIFKEKEKVALLRRLAAERRLIVVTDSDGAGLVIRNYITSILPKSQVSHLYIPQIKGKERRKATPSKEGTLGVEGMEADLLRSLFEPFAVGRRQSEWETIGKFDLYCDGLSGAEGSDSLRRTLARSIGLPEGLSANALVEAINLLGGRPLYQKALDSLNRHENDEISSEKVQQSPKSQQKSKEEAS